MEAYEQYAAPGRFWSWVMLLGLSGLLIGWAMMMHMAVPDVPREWDFGQLPDTPAESKYNTVQPPEHRPGPTQLPRPPGSGSVLYPAGPPASASAPESRPTDVRPPGPAQGGGP